MYKSQLTNSRTPKAFAIIDGKQTAVIFEVKACEETGGMTGILVCTRAPKGTDLGDTFSYERGEDDAYILFYDLGEFIPTEGVK